jgi:diguanylate cyclase (GGDEF)-like protein
MGWGAPAVRRKYDLFYEDLSERFRDALLAGSAKTAEQVSDQALVVGQDAAAVQARVLAPAMRMIGEFWEQDRISVADEHLATAISHAIAARLFRHLLQGEARSRDRVILAATQGEHHVLGMRMVADVLEGAGYDVMYLGADVPFESLLQTCRKYRPAVLGWTVSMALNVPTLLWEIGEISKLDHPPAVMVGGRGLADAIDQGLSAPVVADSEHVVAVVGRLIADPPQAPYVAPALAARIPQRGPGSSISFEAIGTIPAAFSATALAAADSVRDAARRGHAIEQLAYRDELTGLWNRRACDDRLLALAEKRSSPTAVLMLDIDKFKTINDTYGHEAGDAALVHVAEMIAAAIRPSDFASRFGGDEFMILLPSTTAQQAMVVAERIRVAVEKNLVDPAVTVSIGVALTSESSLTTRLAVDGALYRAKDTGRNQIATSGE